jgi:hypothetical protein
MEIIVAIWSAIVTFFDSNFFVALITLAVGSLAIYMYKKQQSDGKKDAANILLLEIKNAESQLMQAKEIILRDVIIPESIFSMKTSSWSKYGYLFIRDLTDEEWRLINNFYEKCRQYDEVVEYNNNFFKKNEEQMRINLQQAVADYTKKMLEKVGEAFEINDEKERNEKNQETLKEYKELVSGFYDTFMSELTSANSKYSYNPQKPFHDAEVLISTIRLDLSTSTVGIKLEQIIQPKGRK